MDNIVLWAGLILFSASIILLNRTTTKFADDLILEYQKKIKPGFIRFYLIGMIPFLIILASFMAEELGMMKFIWLIVILTFAWDFITLLKVRTLVIASERPKAFDEVKLYISLLLFGKTLSMVGLFLYISEALTL